jgi:hypothetical protein
MFFNLVVVNNAKSELTFLYPSVFIAWTMIFCLKAIIYILSMSGKIVRYSRIHRGWRGILESNLNVILLLFFTSREKRTIIQNNLTEHFKARILLYILSGLKHSNSRFWLYPALISLYGYKPNSRFSLYSVNRLLL